MTKFTYRYKWHYYSSRDEVCVMENPYTGLRKIVRQTYCGRDPYKVALHTEFKDRVDCICCLRMINTLART